MIEHSIEKALANDLWQTALDTVDTIEMDTACSDNLRGWIATGIQRMIRQDRVTLPDMTLAHANLSKFIEFLKKEAVYHGTPRCLDSNSFRAAEKDWVCVRPRPLLSSVHFGRKISNFINAQWRMSRERSARAEGTSADHRCPLQ
jgi:hypothetical protein